jgi:hypothetical protein
MQIGSGLIRRYYEERKLKRPNSAEAILWAITELGEVCELYLARDPEWVRNNPEDKEPFSTKRFAEELGDVITMLQVAGRAMGRNPIATLDAKIRRKLKELHNAEHEPGLGSETETD